MFGGQLGGPMEALAPLIGEQLGVERVAMEVSHENGTHRVKVGDDGEVAVEEIVPWGKENGEPAKLTGIFHPAGEEFTIAKATDLPRQRIRYRHRLRGPLRLRQPVLLGRLALEATRPLRRGRPAGPGRAQVVLLGVLLGLAAVAWLIAGDRMNGMQSTPGMGLGSLGFYVTVWVVMMAAMMFPSVAPAVLMYDRLREGHRARGKGAAADATARSVLGYLLVWTAAGLGAYGLLELFHALRPSFLAWQEAGRYVAGGVIVVAAIYQVTPLKRACLVKCRSPMMFLAERWKGGRMGALELGSRHGAWCPGAAGR